MSDSLSVTLTMHGVRHCDGAGGNDDNLLCVSACHIHQNVLCASFGTSDNAANVIKQNVNICVRIDVKSGYRRCAQAIGPRSSDANHQTRCSSRLFCYSSTQSKCNKVAYRDCVAVGSRADATTNIFNIQKKKKTKQRIAVISVVELTWRCGID